MEPTTTSKPERADRTGVPIADDLRDMRKRAGFTQAQVCARADCSLTHLQSLEAGVIPLRPQALHRVLAVLASELEAQVGEIPS